MEKVQNIFESIKWLILDILFPESCLSCHKKGEILCFDCMSNIKRAERETTKDIFAIFDYRDPIIKQAIWKLKYYGKRALGKKLGEFLYKEMLEEVSDMRLYSSGLPIIVIPVPLSIKRQQKRGYNQAMEIAKGFCVNSSGEILELRGDLVIKNINTKPQARIENRKERLKNLEGAFSVVDEQYIKARTIIVIDDVTTTGGTMNEISKILKSAGAKKVVGIAIAH
jgi:ComF family protein